MLNIERPRTTILLRFRFRCSRFSCLVMHHEVSNSRPDNESQPENNKENMPANIHTESDRQKKPSKVIAFHLIA